MILIIDHFDSFSYNLSQLVTTLGYPVQVHRCNEIDLNDIQTLSPDCIILSPGPGGPRETGISLSLLSSAWGQQTPCVGICLGFQAMAESLGCPVKLADTVVHGKTIDLKTTQHPIYNKLETSISVARYHSLCVWADDAQMKFKLISCHEKMVMAAEGIHQPWIGLQYHPESFLTPTGPKIVANAFAYLKQRAHSMSTNIKL